MPLSTNKIMPCLWFDTQAEEAVNFYVSIFKNSKAGRASRYGKEGHAIHGMPEGMAMAIDFELDGHPFVALNGGPHFKFNEAISLQIQCYSQEEIDDFSERLTEGGGAQGPCGWLKDRFGLSWQVTPAVLTEMLLNPDASRRERVTKAFLQMKKFDLAALHRAFDGTPAA